MRVTSLLVVLSLTVVLHTADARRRRCCGRCRGTPPPCPTLIPQTCPPPVIPHDCPVCPSYPSPSEPTPIPSTTTEPSTSLRPPTTEPSTTLPPPTTEPSTTSAPPTTEPTTTSPPPTTYPTTLEPTTTPDCKCSPNGVDLVFVIDASDSVGKNNFKTMLQFAKQLVANLFNRRHGVIQVAANTYSTEAKLQFKLNQHQGLERIQAAIDLIPYDQRETNLQRGLENVLSEIVGETNGDRANAENLIVILADGDSNNDPYTPARKLIKLNNLLVAVGIGKEVDIANLESITGRSDLVFKVDQFNELSDLVDKIANRQCHVHCPGLYGDVVFKSNSLPILGEFKTCQHCD